MTQLAKKGATKLSDDDAVVRGSNYRRSQFRKADDLDDVYVSPSVSDEELAAWRDRLKLFEGKGTDKPVATYKLEIQFGVSHHVHGSTYGTITVWENGSHFNGYGDALLYQCPGQRLLGNGCDAVVDPEATKILVDGKRRPAKVVICRSCYVSWKPEDLIGQTFYRLPIESWADVVYRWYLRLNMDADIRVKYNYDDIRVASQKEQEKELRGEVLNRARSSARRKPRVYPLENIIRDVSAGADLRKRILVFLKE